MGIEIEPHHIVWQDCPPGHQLRVAAIKADGGPCLCLKCYYIKRGSFGALKIGELVDLLHANPPLKDKSFGFNILHISFSPTHRHP